MPEKTKWTQYVQPSDYTGPKVKWPQRRPEEYNIDDIPVAGQKQWTNNYSERFLTSETNGDISTALPEGRIPSVFSCCRRLALLQSLKTPAELTNKKTQTEPSSPGPTAMLRTCSMCLLLPVI